MPTYTDTEADTIAVSDVVSFVSFPGASPNDIVALVDSATFQFRAGANLTDSITISETVTAGTIGKLSVSDAIVFADSVFKALKLTVSDSVALADTVKATRALLVADAINFQDLVKFKGIYKLSLVDTILANEVLQNFWGETAVDSIAISDTVSPQWMYGGNLSDTIALVDSVTPTLMMHVQTTDAVVLSDTALLSAIYHEILSDSISIKVALLDPGGGFTTWCVNTRTAAITEYNNFSYNSFTQMGNHYLGASSTGLYQLDGTLDDKASIIAQVKSGSAQFAGSRFTSFDAIYLGCRVSDSGNDWILKLHAGDGREYVYQFHPLNRRTTKIFPGKGLRARYFAWELITAGQDFDLDEIEFVPIGSKRRT